MEKAGDSHFLENLREPEMPTHWPLIPHLPLSQEFSNSLLLG